MEIGGAGESGNSGVIDVGFIIDGDNCVRVEIDGEESLAFVNKLLLFLEVVDVGIIVGQWTSFLLVIIDEGSFIEEESSTVTTSPDVNGRVLDFGLVIDSFISSFNDKESK